jgi:hypothetical protein
MFGSLGCNDDFIQKKQTNADKIRSMSDEELAEFLDIIASDCSDETCENCSINKNGFCNHRNTVEWLQSEVENEQE